MNNSKYDELLKKIKKGQINTCMIKQHEDITFEYYRYRKVETSTHPIHSCSKSVISILIGICIKEGLIQNIHTPIKEYFGNYFTHQKDIRKEAITIYHLLTMTPGFDWPEFGEWNFGTPMEFSKDMVGFVLDRNLESAPGIKMVYNSGCSNILSAIIQIASGMKTIDFAYQYLFTPLGIQDVVWHEKQGISLGANGLRMKPSDLLSLGSLYLNGGKKNNKQIVPKEWIVESIQPRFLTYPDIGHYGYHWWMSDFESENGTNSSCYFAMGLFGQFIIVVPAKEMVVIFISDNYGDTMKPMRYFRDFMGSADDQS